jgi:hypothetical protein
VDLNIKKKIMPKSYQLLSLLILTIVSFLTVPSVSAGVSTQGDEDPIPLLAYYYIWFDRGSWERAKSDLPLLGSYSSDEEKIMRQHIQWAKLAGIDGFIVSWKSTERLNLRLAQLIKIAVEEHFKLAIIYQGLDFERRPLPVGTILADLQYFISEFSESEAFDLFSSPLVIWSGTWEFSRDEIHQVTAELPSNLFILASERHVDTYQVISDLVDGNAYYWSSVDPDRFPGYQEKLDEIGESVHQHGGLWIAPAAPGFDARLIEGTRVVERKNGETLFKELGVAYGSSPDAVGIISWNEFSENTHIEPSKNYGLRSLEVLAEFNTLPIPEIIEFDSSEPPSIILEPELGRFVTFGLMGVLVLVSIFIIFLRGVKSRQGE